MINCRKEKNMRNIYDIISEQKALVDVELCYYELKYLAEEFDYLQESVSDSLKNMWEKLKKWFIDMINKIKSFFSNSKKSVGRVNYTELERNIKNDDKVKNETITTNIYKPIQLSLNSANKLLNELKKIGLEKGTDKEKIFDKISNLQDKSKEGLIKLVKSFVIEKENVEIKISDLDLQIFNEYATREKDVIDAVKKEQNSLEALFRNEIEKIEKSGGTERNELFNYVISLAVSITKAYVQFVISAANVSVKLINRLIKSTKSDTNNKDGMVADFLKEIDKNDIEGLRRKIIVLIQNDPTFEKNYFNDALDYLKMDDLLFEKNNDNIPLVSSKKSTNYNDDDYVDAVYNLQKNFSKEKLNDVKKIGKLTH
jgi:hypothetical protein